MKRFLGAVASLLLVLMGVLLASVGGLGLAVFGTTGQYAGPGSEVAGSDEAVALVADLAGVEIGIPLHRLLGAATLTAQTPDGSPVFIGRADQSAVDGYLFGAPYDLASKNGTWQTTAVPGVETALPPPSEQSFWTSSSSGSAATIALDPQGEPETLVVMNDDASPGVVADLTLGFSGGRIFAYSVAAIALGVLLVVLALAVAVRGRRRRQPAEVTNEPVVALSASDAAETISLFSSPGTSRSGEVAKAAPSDGPAA